MTIAIEASSLSQITDIAANPPLQLENFQHKHSQPLILYIARVPGRRDVFLTPLKPRDKVVTAEDVQSSLYYVHINNNDDADIMSTALENQRHEIASQDLDRIAPDHSTDHRNYSVQHPYSLSKPTTHTTTARKPLPKRKPVLSDITNSSTPTSSPFSNIPLLPPRPLPSLPVAECPASEQYQSTERYSTSSYEASLRSLPMTPAEVDRHEALSGTLTVIRRNPATADQWNVAIVRDPIAAEAQSIASSRRSSWIRPTKVNQYPLNLEVTTPAYRLFSQAESALSSTSDISQVSHEPMATFSRQLHCPDTTFSNTANIAANRTSMSSDEQSWKRASRFSVNADLSTYSPNQSKRRLHYSFASPWNGQCMFTTSSTGRSLRCSHRPVHDQQAVDVSELRFNLPAQSQPAASAVHSKRFSQLGNLHRRLQSHDQALSANALSPRNGTDDNDYDDDDMSMDLSLGQERAGGGMGGKQAKLGKLIIHSDGLPMLDLLVAANIGLWWRAWERTLTNV